MPRLELDQLLAELVNRAEDLMAAQERLRGLLRANALAIALAAAAGGAIANARRFTESEHRRRWLAASTDLTPLLLSGG